VNLYGYVYGNPVNLIDPKGLEVVIDIYRVFYSNSSIIGKINVYSTVTGSTFFGYTLENANPPNANLPVPQGTYGAFTNTRHKIDRIELTGVPHAEAIQIHEGNKPKDVKGCFAAGTSRSKDRVAGSVDAMGRINSIVTDDGGKIMVNVIGPNGR
jgi:hypothetical protein